MVVYIHSVDTMVPTNGGPNVLFISKRGARLSGHAGADAIFARTERANERTER